MIIIHPKVARDLVRVVRLERETNHRAQIAASGRLLIMVPQNSHSVTHLPRSPQPPFHPGGGQAA